MKVSLVGVALALALSSAPVPASAADYSGVWQLRSREVGAADQGVVSYWTLEVSTTGPSSYRVTLDTGAGTYRLSGSEANGALVLRGTLAEHPLVMRSSGSGDSIGLTAEFGQERPDAMPFFTATRITAKALAAMRALRARVTIRERQPLAPLRVVPDNGLARVPPMGWNSWNRFKSAIDDASVRAIARAMVTTGLAQAGYVHVNLDDGWQGTRDAAGNHVPNANFPDMKALAGYIHGLGLKFGIYSSPGPLSCTGRIGSHGHEERDARTFAEWGVDYLKYDRCSAGEIYPTSTERRVLFQRMGEALLATGRPIVYSGGDAAWARKAGSNLWRTNTDIRPVWESIAANGFDNNGRPEDAGPGGWNDPDMLEIGNGELTAAESRSHMTLWAMSAAPLILGNDPRTVDAETLSILTNRDVIAIDQDPLGISAQPLMQSGGIEIWARPLSGGDMAVAVFNRRDEEQAVNLDWRSVGLTGLRRGVDVWRDDATIADTGYAGVLPPHGSVLIRYETYAELVPQGGARRGVLKR